MKSVLAALALLAAAAPAAAQNVDVGRANWDKLPDLKIKGRDLPMEFLVTKVEEIFEAEQCTSPSRNPHVFDITVPYAVLVQPDGKASRILVSDMGCTPLETLVGNVVISRADLGDIGPTGESAPRWFKSQINFTLE